LHHLYLALPCLEALHDNGPLRHGQLVYALTSATGRAVHSKTLNNALRYLTGNDLAVRRRGATPNTVVYEITEFGRSLLRIFEDADQAFERHLQNGDPRPPGGQDA
jgi:DNA-binding HxlR family transcriptional regulator